MVVPKRPLKIQLTHDEGPLIIPLEVGLLNNGLPFVMNHVSTNLKPAASPGFVGLRVVSDESMSHVVRDSVLVENSEQPPLSK